MARIASQFEFIRYYSLKNLALLTNIQNHCLHQHEPAMNLSRVCGEERRWLRDDTSHQDEEQYLENSAGL